MKSTPFIPFLAIALAAVTTQFAWAADAKNGEQVFNQKCQVCHSMKSGENQIGPSLAGIFGQKVASVSGYDYSDALKDSNVVWNAQNLDKWLANPQDFLPGNKMTTPGLENANERQDIIAYLKESK